MWTFPFVVAKSDICYCFSAGIIAGSDMITCVGILLFHSLISDEVLLKILDLPILVVLDEAYIEFSGIESRMQWVKKHENLIVLRTFSKRAGMYKFGPNIKKLVCFIMKLNG